MNTVKMIAFLMSAVLLSGCVCRPGHVGPYGGLHPGRCVVY
jgi:hypothetical protein